MSALKLEKSRSIGEELDFQILSYTLHHAELDSVGLPQQP